MAIKKHHIPAVQVFQTADKKVFNGINRVWGWVGERGIDTFTQ